MAGTTGATVSGVNVGAFSVPDTGEVLPGTDVGGYVVGARDLANGVMSDTGGALTGLDIGRYVVGAEV